MWDIYNWHMKPGDLDIFDQKKGDLNNTEEDSKCKLNHKIVLINCLMG